MTTTAVHALAGRLTPKETAALGSTLRLALVFGPFLVLWLGQDWLPQWMRTVPETWTIPFVAWVNAAVDVLSDDPILGLVTFKEITRAIARMVEWPAWFIEGVLISGFPAIGLPSLPWVTIAGLAAVLGWWLNGWRLALIAGGCITYLAVFGIWKLSMVTFAAVLVAAPLAALGGLVLGLIAYNWPPFERALRPLLNLMQSLPHFSYLIPVAVFIGVSHRAGIIATILFALPPMARLTILGLRGVPGEIIEAGLMGGCTARQMLWKVQLPAARPALMVGVNQVIMQCLAMVVIASFVGARGLGQDLLFRLQNLRIGQAFEIGVAIVLMAIMLDRLSLAMSAKQPERGRSGPFWHVHPHLSAGIVVLGVTLLGAAIMPSAHTWPDHLTLTTAPVWDRLVDYVTTNFAGAISVFHDNLLLYILIPLRESLQTIPWTAAVILVASAGWVLGGPPLAALVSAFVLFIAFSGFWAPALITAYMVLFSVVVCVLIGVPVGIWGAGSERRARLAQLWCDTFQTFPSFIYLIPVIMLFRVGDVAAITAIVIYAIIPAIRYTVFGLRNVPLETCEAAEMAGCTRWQSLRKVKLPLAMPEIMLGINQTIMFALFMVIIAAFIGTKGLGQEIFRALTFADAGKGLVIGLCVAFMGLTADRLITEWADRRKVALGL